MSSLRLSPRTASEEEKLVTAQQVSQRLTECLVSEQSGAGFFTYPNFLCYLTREGAALDHDAFADTYARVAQRLLTIAGTRVYIADEMVFTGEVLNQEFPELELFRMPLSDAFVESRAHPNIFIETKRFAGLHILSRMRRELRQSGRCAPPHSIEVVKILLGLAT